MTFVATPRIYGIASRNFITTSMSPIGGRMPVGDIAFITENWDVG